MCARHACGCLLHLQQEPLTRLGWAELGSTAAWRPTAKLCMQGFPLDRSVRRCTKSVRRCTTSYSVQCR